MSFIGDSQQRFMGPFTCARDAPVGIVSRGRQFQQHAWFCLLYPHPTTNMIRAEFIIKCHPVCTNFVADKLTDFFLTSEHFVELKASVLASCRI